MFFEFNFALWIFYNSFFYNFLRRGRCSLLIKFTLTNQRNVDKWCKFVVDFINWWFDDNNKLFLTLSRKLVHKLLDDLPWIWILHKPAIQIKFWINNTSILIVLVGKFLSYVVMEYLLMSIKLSILVNSNRKKLVLLTVVFDLYGWP